MTPAGSTPRTQEIIMITKQQAKVEKAQIFQAQQVPITSKEHQKHDIHDVKSKYYENGRQECILQFKQATQKFIT